MISRTAIAYLKLGHGFYNTVMALLFLYQGVNGLRIRLQRKKGVMVPRTVRRHRRWGPLLVWMAAFGFLYGFVLVNVDYRNPLKYPLHLANGTLLVASILAASLVSKKIRARDAAWRTPHLMLGILIICLYAGQIISGIGILF